jgi:Ca2+/Na+ antiporter
LTIQSSASDIQLEPMSIWRDVGIYIVATVSVIVFGLIGELTSISAAVMLCEYAMLVLIVYVDEKRNEVPFLIFYHSQER